MQANTKLNVMLAWCKSVALGRMQNGPLLAHSKIKNDEIVMNPSGKYLVPKERYQVCTITPGMIMADMALQQSRKFFVQHYVWPRDIMTVAA
ncbi:MAG: hypothetical protein ACKPKO_32555, partial [Candidatus Fonsibacter sp.]